MQVETLGVAQDGGVPHLDCRCETCERAREDPGKRRYPAALLLRGKADGVPVRYLVDAPPDLRHTLATVPDGVLLTHAHLGHLPGLLSFGPEAADATDLPVYCTPSLAALVRENQPFRALIDGGTLDVRPTEPGTTVALADGTVELHRVPHRSETGTDTVALRVVGPERSLCYVPDLDAWTADAISLVADADLALVDGTFFDEAETDRYDEVPHPTVVDSMEALADCATEVWFTHCNHTNPLLREASPERRMVTARGFGVLERGAVFEL